MTASGKKGGPLQLQAEVNTDEEWGKLVEKDGLIVVDVYSEWCGPCLGMVGNLKKLKVEVGGDNLHLAIAKSDGIDCLKRFRKKSEPTWMFIAGGNIVNLMFGADAPRLTRMIKDELKNEAEAQKNERERTKIPFNELTPEEKARKSIEDKKLADISEIETKAAKIVQTERRRKRTDIMAPFIADYNILLFWPHAIEEHKTVIEAWDPLGITVTDRENPQLTEEQIYDLFFDTEEIFENSAARAILAEQPCFTMLLKTLPDKGDILEKVKKVIYEDKIKSEKTQTGNDDSENEEPTTVAQRLAMITEDEIEIPGVFTPKDPISKAIAINVLYPKVVAQFVEPEIPLLPPHVALVFDAFKRREVLDACAEFEKDVLKLGFFSSGDMLTAKNIGITPEEYENNQQPKEYGEKLVIMLSKAKSDALLAFTDLGPSYMSPNAVDGAKECAIYFPAGYGEKPPEVVTKVKKKKGKQKKMDSSKAASSDKPGTEVSEKSTEQSVATTDVEENGDKNESDDGTEAPETEEVDIGVEEIPPDGEDKATSPMMDGGDI